MSGCLSCAPDWRPGLHPWQVPWPGIEPVILWFAVWPSIPCHTSQAPHLLFHKLWGHLLTLRYIFNAFCICVFVLCTQSWNSIDGEVSVRLSPSQTWADFNNVRQHSLAVRHLQCTHEKESDLLEISRGYLWGRTGTIMWQVKSKKQTKLMSGLPKPGCE